MGLPAPPSDDFTFWQCAVGVVGAVASAAFGFAWRVGIKAGAILSDVKTLQEWRDKFEIWVDADRSQNDRRHEENLKALAKIPDIEDFRRLEDRMEANFRDIKGSLGLTPPPPRRRSEGAE